MWWAATSSSVRSLLLSVTMRTAMAPQPSCSSRCAVPVVTSRALRRVRCQWRAHHTTRNTPAPIDSTSPAPDTAVERTV